MSFDFFDEAEQSDEIMNEINMIPLIDVMLVLLIIFIITAPIMHHVFKLELPEASNIQQEIKPDTIQIAVESDNKYRWNNHYVSKKELEINIQQVALSQPQPEIHLHADRNVRYELIIHVLHIAQQASLSKIGFITSPESE